MQIASTTAYSRSAISAAMTKPQTTAGDTANNTDNADSTANSRQGLLSALNAAMPGLSVQFETLPESEQAQEKLFRAGKLAAVTIAPQAADKMQNDTAFQQQVIGGIQADQAFYKDRVDTVGNTTVKVLAHGTVVEPDGAINGWTFSEARTTADSAADSSSITNADKKTFLQRLAEKLKKDRATATADTSFAAATPAGAGASGPHTSLYVQGSLADPDQGSAPKTGVDVVA